MNIMISAVTQCDAKSKCLLTSCVCPKRNNDPVSLSLSFFFLRLLSHSPTQERSCALETCRFVLKVSELGGG
jgi:hypothetical protein